MALLLKRLCRAYFDAMESADRRVKDWPLMSSPFPTLIIVYLWYQFVFKWGPKYMKNREPLDIKRIIIVYNALQVFVNSYIFYYLILSINVIDWSCAHIDYSDNYWARKHLLLAYYYFLLKIADLLDTVFFILRKKSTHVSFLHTYHHALMVLATWFGVNFVGGGHSYFIGFANCLVHAILYSYYLLTAYDSKYSKVIWLKKCITQAQLTQFAFLFFCYLRVFFVKNCKYPKYHLVVLLPQNAFMVVLFADFYIKTYIIAPRRRNKLQEGAMRNEASIVHDD